MRSAICAAAALAVVTAGARAAVPKQVQWDRISGPTLSGPQLGLHRVGGVLNVAWEQGNPATITVTRLDKTGTATGSSVVTTGFDGLGGLALLGMPDGSLRLFASGGRTRGLPSHQSGINSYTSPPGGTTWSFDSSGPFGGAVASAADEIGATIAGNGWIVTSWSGAIVHIGVNPSDGDPSYQEGCCGAEPELVTQSDGSVVLAWIDNSSLAEGTMVREILPTPEAQYLLPSGLSPGSFGLAHGETGAYVAYVDPSKQKVQLYEYGGGLQTLATGQFQVAKVFSSTGRVWVMWGSGSDGVYISRSNFDVTRFEPVQHLALPAGTNGFYNAQGDGSRGPLELFVDVLKGTTDRGFWHTHLLPVPTVSAKVNIDSLTGNTKNHKYDIRSVTFRVTDAGDPIAHAEISYHWYGDLKFLVTGKDGRVTTPAELTHGKPVPVMHVHIYVPGYAYTTFDVGPHTRPFSGG